MRLDRRLSPTHTAAVSLGGAMLLYLYASGLGIFEHFERKPSHPRFLPLFWGLILPLLLGCSAMVWGWSALENGIAADVWPEVKLTKLRAALDGRSALLLSRTSAALGGVWILAGAMQLGAPGPHRGENYGVGGFAYCFIAPWVTVQRLRRLLAPPEPPSFAANWTKNMKPIVSDHWGE